MGSEAKKAFIRLENISKSYISKGRRVDAVKHVNLNIEKGKIVGIIGFSGAGKSTLVRCINLLERPTEGRVFIGDSELTAMGSRELRQNRKRIGMIFQHFNLFVSRTVRENVAFPLRHTGLSKSQIEDRVNELLELVGLSDRGDVYPSQLSGGQKQRVAIARALASEPEVLLSDEATSALDPETTKSILQLLKKLNAKLGITIIIITHEMQVVKEICDEALVMDNGEPIEYGKVFDIFANPSSPITKRFVENTTNLSKIYEMAGNPTGIPEIDQGRIIARFTYLERSSAEALVSRISREYGIDVNIIFGDISIIGNNPVGGLAVILSGETDDIKAAIKYLREINVGVEVIRSDGIIE